MKTLRIDIDKDKKETKFHHFKTKRYYKTMKRLIHLKMKFMKDGEFYFNDAEQKIICKFKSKSIQKGFIKELESNVNDTKAKGLNTNIEIKYTGGKNYTKNN